MDRYKFLEQFFEEQHHKWKKIAPLSVRKENNPLPDSSGPFNQASSSEPVTSSSSNEDKNKSFRYSKP